MSTKSTDRADRAFSLYWMHEERGITGDAAKAIGKIDGVLDEQLSGGSRPEPDPSAPSRTSVLESDTTL